MEEINLTLEVSANKAYRLDDPGGPGCALAAECDYDLFLAILDSCEGYAQDVFDNYCNHTSPYEPGPLDERGRIQWVKAERLIVPEVLEHIEEQRLDRVVVGNAPVWAFLKLLPPDWPVALFWFWWCPMGEEGQLREKIQRLRAGW